MIRSTDRAGFIVNALLVPYPSQPEPRRPGESAATQAWKLAGTGLPGG
jgi:hypothetical protein